MYCRGRIFAHTHTHSDNGTAPPFPPTLINTSQDNYKTPRGLLFTVYLQNVWFATFKWFPLDLHTCRGGGGYWTKNRSDGVCRKIAGIRDQVLRERRPFSLAWSQHFPHKDQLTGRRGVWSMPLFCLFLLVRCCVFYWPECNLSWMSGYVLDFGGKTRHDAENGIFLNVMSVCPALTAVEIRKKHVR